MKKSFSFPFLISFSFLFFTAAHGSANVTLEAGTQYESHLLEGSATVRCRESHGGSSTHLIYCRATTLEPSMTSYAVGPNQTGADELILTATHESGSQTTKSMDYDDEEG